MGPVFPGLMIYRGWRSGSPVTMLITTCCSVARRPGSHRDRRHGDRVLHVLTLSASNDIIAYKFHISLNATTWIGRIGMLVIPPLAFFIAYRWGGRPAAQRP